MNAKISVFVVCVAAIIYLLLYNLHDCTFNMHKYIETYLMEFRSLATIHFDC